MNKLMKSPNLESIQPGFGSSIRFQQYNAGCNEAAHWHFHPELEIVYVNGGSGKRHIGNHISYYHEGDLLFIGANLPHFGFTDEFTGNKSETVVQVLPNFLGEEFFERPELQHVKQLLKRAKQGISFHGQTKNRVGQAIEKLKEVPPFERLLQFLNVLHDMATSSEYQLLCVDGIAIESNQEDNNRIERVVDYVSAHYREDIPLAFIADMTNMTVPSFCRYFKRKTGKTFTKFVNSHRIVHASKLLAEQPMSITEVCYASGFNNFSHFHKQFKEITGKSPSEYRNQFKNILTSS